MEIVIKFLRGCGATAGWCVLSVWVLAALSGGTQAGVLFFMICVPMIGLVVQTVGPAHEIRLIFGVVAYLSICLIGWALGWSMVWLANWVGMGFSAWALMPQDRRPIDDQYRSFLRKRPDIFLRGNEEILHGSKVVDFKIPERFSRPEAIKLAGFPLTEDQETRHIAVIGNTGTGKTVAISRMLLDARNRGDSGIVVDVAGNYLSRLYKKGDLVLNPFDARSSGWSPFVEFESVFDFQQLSAAVIPQGTGSAEEWNMYARNCLAAVLQGLYHSGQHSVTVAIKLLSTATLEELQPLFAGTPAATMLLPENAEYMGSVRGVLSQQLTAWPYLERGQGMLSLRQWIRNKKPEGGQFIWITFPESQKELLKDLAAMWLSVAINELLDQTEDKTRRIWFVADELASLGKLSIAEDAVTKLRRFGGRVCFCFQQFSQPRSIYGRDPAITLLGNMSTKLLLACGDHETAEYASNAIGQRRVLRTERSESSGGEHQTSNTSQRAEDISAVSPSVFTNLDPLRGYLLLPGSWPTLRVELNPADSPPATAAAPYLKSAFVQLAPKKLDLPPPRSEEVVIQSNDLEAQPQQTSGRKI